MNSIEEKLEEIDGSPAHIELYCDIERDYRLGNKNIEDDYEETLLANIEQQLLYLSYEKIKGLLDKNSNMTYEEINCYWQKIAATINSPEKLELIGEDSKKYKGIGQLRTMFMSLRTAMYYHLQKTARKSQTTYPPLLSLSTEQLL